MRRFLENRITVAAVLLLFAGALAWNTAQSSRTAMPRHFQADFSPAASQASTPPPDLQDQIAHGPGMRGAAIALFACGGMDFAVCVLAVAAILQRTDPAETQAAPAR